MGQKAHPIAMRLGIIKDWKAKWFTSDKKKFVQWTVEDRRVRKYFHKFIKPQLIGDIIISRENQEELVIEIWTAKPGLVLGQAGVNVKKHEKSIKKLLGSKNRKVKIEVKEITSPDLNAQIVASEIAISLENRGSFRIAQKKAIKKTMFAGAKGIKTLVSGRLNGVDMARSEGYSEGVTPLQTLRNDIDFAISEANTTYGVIGVKVWISRGEILKNKKEQLEASLREKTLSLTEVKKPSYKRNVKNYKNNPLDTNK